MEEINYLKMKKLAFVLQKYDGRYTCTVPYTGLWNIGIPKKFSRNIKVDFSMNLCYLLEIKAKYEHIYQLKLDLYSFE